MNQNPPALRPEPCFLRFAGLTLWVALLAALGVLIVSAPRGLEGTDEASWVLCAANPWQSPGYGIFFGFFLHPLWVLTGHVAGFRVAGMVAVLGAAWVFFFFLLRAGTQLGCGNLLRRHGWVLAASLGIAVLTRYAVGIRSPGYDWVLLVSALLYASGWLWLEGLGAGKSPVGAIGLCTLGLAGIFVGKWLALPGYLVLSGCLFFRRFSRSERGRMILVFGGWILLWLILLFFYVTPQGLLDTVRAGFAQVQTGSHTGLVRHYAIGFLKGTWQVVRAYPWVAILYGLVWGVLYLARHRKSPEASLVAGICFLAGLGLAAWRGYFFGGLTTFSKGMMVTMVWLSGVYLMGRPFRKALGQEKPHTKIISPQVTWMLGLLPLLNGVGTATGITDYLGHGLIFFVAVGWIFLAQAMEKGLPVWCALAAVLTLGLIQSGRAITSTFNQYKIGSVWRSDLVTVSTGPEKGRLRTFPASVQFLEKIRGQMDRAGYREGDPILGLTDLPGLVYLLGGVSPGVCWYISHYLPENRGVETNLAQLRPEVLARCWVLERETLRPNERLDATWPGDRGVAIPRRVQGEFFWPWGDGEGQPERIFLYRPAAVPQRR